MSEVLNPNPVAPTPISAKAAGYQGAPAPGSDVETRITELLEELLKQNDNTKKDLVTQLEAAMVDLLPDLEMVQNDLGKARGYLLSVSTRIYQLTNRIKKARGIS